MSELVKKDQTLNVIPQNFKGANKGRVIEFKSNEFLVELKYPPEEISINKPSEFYSPTDNGILYFESKITQINGSILTIENPIKHRYLQRRQFTRIKYNKNMEFISNNKIISIKSLDLSAGGMKLQTNESLDIDQEYEAIIKLFQEQEIKCIFQLIRIEKSDDGIYTISGRFKNLSNVDKMTLVQLCMKKNLENSSK